MMMDSSCVVSLSGRRKISEKKKKRLSPFCVVDMQEDEEEKGFFGLHWQRAPTVHFGWRVSMNPIAPFDRYLF
jgi:hypothetical protein